MRPECKPLMFATATDAGWYLGKEVCRDYRWDGHDKRERAENLVLALLAYFSDEERFADDLGEIFDCAKRHYLDLVFIPEKVKAAAE